MTKINEIMTSQNAKTVLFASLIATMILPFSIIDSADAKTNEVTIKELLKDIDKEATKYVKDDNKEQSKNEKKEELKTKHDEKLDQVVSKLEHKTGHTLDDAKTLLLKNYIVNEVIKHAEINDAYSQNNVEITSETVDIDGFWSIIPQAQSTVNLYPISTFHQPSVDVSGGTGWTFPVHYNVNGGNQLVSVDKIVSNSQNMTRYVLEWADEDDPNPTLDLLYDQYRLAHYNRIADVETFVVLNGVINFDGIWDESHGYGISAHGDETRTWYNGVQIYANTWNHALDIYDHNTQLTKYTGYF